MTADLRRYKVRPDAFYVRRADGVRLSNNTGSFTIRGTGAYRLVAAVLRALDGDHTLDEIVSGLPAGARRSVLELVTTLNRNGFLSEVRHPAESVPPWLRQLYPAQLDFLDLHADRPVARFQRARSAPLLVAGGGLALVALLGALTDFGLANFDVHTTKDDADAVDDVLGAAARRDAALRYQVRHGDRVDLGELSGIARQAGAAAVLLAGDELTAGPGAVTTIGDQWARLRADGRALGVLGRCGDFTVAVPGGPDGCWACVHRWLAARAVASAEQPLPLAAAPASIAAAHLAQHTFLALAGVDPDGFDRIATVEPVVPVVRTHQRRSHPLCPRHEPRSPAVPVRDDDPVRPDVPAPEDHAELVAVADRIVTATTGWLDAVLGPVLGLGEEDAGQVPLAVSRCRVAEPNSTAGSPAVTTVTCLAIAPREARNQVVLAALERLARPIAAAAGVLPANWALGAGWSRAEAHYRARLAAASAEPPGTSEPPEIANKSTSFGPLGPGAPGSAAVRDFLVGELAARGVTWRTTGTRITASGFVRVELDIVGHDPVTGHGVDLGHATGNALLGAVAQSLATQEAGHLAPPQPTWALALDVLNRNARPAPSQDVSSLLEFLDGHACLVAVAASAA